MKKIAPGIGNKAKRFRNPSEKLTGFGKKFKKCKKRVLRKRPKPDGRKPNKRRSK